MAITITEGRTLLECLVDRLFVEKMKSLDSNVSFGAGTLPANLTQLDGPISEFEGELTSSCSWLNITVMGALVFCLRMRRASSFLHFIQQSPNRTFSVFVWLFVSTVAHVPFLPLSTENPFEIGNANDWNSQNLGSLIINAS